MPRPSRNVDQALLASGQALFADLGCSGLTHRAVAEHASVQPGMLHYHFGSKDAFLRAVLQRLYERFFAELSAQALGEGPAIGRLHDALRTLGGFAREHHQLIARLLIDAMQGHEVARAFLRENLPRHLGLIGRLITSAQTEGTMRCAPAAQCLMFLLGAVPLPMIFFGGLAKEGAAPLPPEVVQQQLMSNAAVAERIDWALDALAETPPKRERAQR